ncbi:hypothetical protein VNO78_28877 [Psophocarpus tetragonolobus]|uniref:ACB domain-containing protein n=1 Tax=Psophocarpus tetragonolobus TaxID=3891 RepID=A0AAN9WZN4_PSOTE
MELLTVVDDFFVTASLALLLTFIILKLIEAINDTHTTPKRRIPPQPLSHPQRFTLLPAQTNSQLRFISPVQPATSARTQEITVQPVPSVLFSPVQAVACVGTEHKLEEATVESDSDFFVQSPVKSDLVKEEIAEGTQAFNNSAEQRNVESVVDSGVKDNDDEDDDWEGIERSELEKEFMAATEFVSNEGDRLGSVGSNVKMEFYGLHKVATEGPCREPQPMPLKLSARAKWNAWQKLGNMSPEAAMEQYISFLSDKFPGWMKDTSPGMSENEPTGPEVSESAASDMSTTLSRQQMIVTEREFEQESDSKNRNPLTVLDLENNVKK